MPLLIETQYLPPISTFSQALRAAGLQLEAHEHYQKRSFRNRCDIVAANGVMSLTVPLLSGKNSQQNIRDVRIAYTERWQAQHWQTIVSAYGRSPYFEHYVDNIAPFYVQRYDFLFDFNQALMERIIKLLKLDIKITLSDTYVKNDAITAELKDWRNQSLSRTKFLAQAEPFLKYPQVFEDRHGFLPQLSVLDMLFLCGK